MTEQTDSTPSANATHGGSNSRCTRPRIWSVFAACLLALAIAFLVVPLVLLVAATPPSPRAGASPERVRSIVESVFDTTRGRIHLLIGWELTIGLVAVLAGALSPVPWRLRLGLRLPEMSCREFIAVVVGAVGISLMLAAAYSFLAARSGLTVGLGKIGDEYVQYVRNHFLVALVATALLPGMCEELFFRGYIQTRLCERWGPGNGIVWTSLLFGLVHMSLLHGAAAAVFGLYVGYVTLWARSVLPAMVAHAAYNAITTGLVIAKIGLPGGVVFLAGCLLLLTSTLCLPRGLDGPSADSAESNRGP